MKNFMMKKIITGLFIAISPGGFIIATTPFSDLLKHTEHILLFSLFGILLAIFYLQKDIRRKKHSFPFLPSLNAIMFLVLFFFIAVHAMPCPYMMSASSAQTMIAHPCTQPTTPGSFTLSFMPVIIQSKTVEFVSPIIHIATLIQIPPNKAPPLLYTS